MSVLDPIRRFLERMAESDEERVAARSVLADLPLSVFLGILAAIYRNSIYDKAVNVGTLAAISMPEFFGGYVLILARIIRLVVVAGRTKDSLRAPPR